MASVKPVKEDASASSHAAKKPLISVIVPAKNEEKNIEACLNSLLEQNYRPFEIIVANDQSKDTTGDILARFGGKIRVVNVPQTPEGWTGKNFAIASAVPHAKGEWLLFTDADTRHNPESLRSSLEFASGRDLDILSLLPRCLTGSFIERMIQPAAMAFLGLWVPIEASNNSRSAVAFGNGQYLLLRKKHYEHIGGHDAVRSEFLEDFALMGLSKEARARVYCAFGTDIYGTRMYDSLESLWRGWRRIYVHAFKQNGPSLALKTLSVIGFSILPFIVYAILTAQAASGLPHAGFLWGYLGILLLFILGISAKAMTFVRVPAYYGLLHPVAAGFIAMILLNASLNAFQKKKTAWR